MAELRVIVPDELARMLEQRAAALGQTPAELHRAILQRALMLPRVRLAQALAAMPDCGEDSDFARASDSGGS